MDLKIQGIETFQGYAHMDHCIGCHTCAFTVAYAVLWLEVLLHSAVKVFHIRYVTTGGGSEQKASPTLFFGIQKNALVLKKKILILSILRLNLSFKI